MNLDRDGSATGMASRAKGHPLLYALVSALIGGFAALWFFADVRAVAGGAAICGILVYLSWRQRGFAWPLEARQLRLAETGSESQIRPRWLLVVFSLVIAALSAIAMVILLAT
ncbi:MAG: hypothetical protein ABI658_23395 [Acidimicrobiales bacterium]